MMGWLIALLAGTITGILSAFGIGGGSLLLIYLTSFAAIDQHQAQGINLLYFLPAAAAALPAHHKHGRSLPIIGISAAMTSIYPCGKTSLSANCCSWILFFRMRSTLISMAMI